VIAPADSDLAVPGAATTGRLLVVEDDPFICMEIEAIAEDAGHVVVGVAGRADEAVARALATLPDLVLMDIRLIGARDGIEAALEIRARAGIPSLFVSANTDRATVARAEPARPAGWVPKPFTRQQLLAAIAAALAHRTGV
jgi:CheY-like chemotaxis protein